MKILFLILALPSVALAQLDDPAWLATATKPVAAAGPASFTDNCTRSDENPLSKSGAWTSGAGATDDLRLLSNRIQATQPATICGAIVNAPTFSADQAAEMTTGATSPFYSRVCVRVQSASNFSCYWAYTRDDNLIEVAKVTDTGSLGAASLGTVGFTAVDGSIIKITASGMATTTIRLYTNGVLAATYTDSSSPWTSGQPGLAIQYATGGGKVKNFQADDL